MIRSLAADLIRIDGCQVSALRDLRVLDLSLPGCNILDVQSTPSHWEEFERLAAEADATILIAPELDDILQTTARRATTSGGRLFSPSADFIRITADKQRTAEVLTMAGVPVPPAVVLDSDDPLPSDFDYPAVLKPVIGAGSQDTQLVASPYDDPPPYAWPRRLERYQPGLAASVAFLCGPAGNLPLPPCKQWISEDGRLQYLGGELPLMPGLAKRAVDLAKRTLDALPTTVGYVGVDLILGPDPHGGEDFAIEVNPRLTTSYVGLRAAANENLAEAMCYAARGEAVELTFSEKPLQFNAEGDVSFSVGQANV